MSKLGPTNRLRSFPSHGLHYNKFRGFFSTSIRHEGIHTRRIMSGLPAVDIDENRIKNAVLSYIQGESPKLFGTRGITVRPFFSMSLDALAEQPCSTNF